VTVKRQKSANLVGFYLRVPLELKERIDALAQERRTSQAQVVVDLVSRAIDMPAPDPKVSDWLKRVGQ
jgi:predicted transcriptional regulator